MMTVSLTTRLDASPDRVWDEARKPRLLFHIGHPLMKFTMTDPDHVPDYWDCCDYLVSLRLYGVIPLGSQTISISYPEPTEQAFYLRDKGHSASIRRWDHLVTVARDAEGTLYTDYLEIEAGLRTPLVTAFAWWFYAHRQGRLRILDRNGFDY